MKSGNTTISAYTYDGLGHRITETPDANVTSGDKTDLFYSAQWQVIEEDTNDSGLTLQTQYVWSPVYVNALIFRDYDFNADGVFEITDRTYAMQDANYDVTTLLDYDNHTLIGDINSDLHVDDLDQSILTAHWQQSVTPGTDGDLNGDGFVDILDLTLLANHFGDSDGFKSVEHFAYSAYGIATCYDATWTTTSDTLDWNYLFQGGRLDKSTGDINFEDRDYNPRTYTWNTKDPLGFVNGPDVYQLEVSNPINDLDPTGLMDPDKSGGTNGLSGDAANELYNQEQVEKDEKNLDSNGWNLTRNGGARATATVCGSTVAQLASEINLSASQYTKWLKSEDGKPLPSSPDEILTKRTFSIPNTAYIDVSSLGRGGVYLLNYGWVISLQDQWENQGLDVIVSYGMQKNGILQHLASSDIIKFGYVGHGDDSGFLETTNTKETDTDNQWTIRQSDITNALHYSLAEIRLRSCWSNNAANQWANGVSANGSLETFKDSVSVFNQDSVMDGGNSQ